MDTLDVQEPVATAEVPLLDGMRLQWTKCLMRGDSYYAMRRLIYQMGEEAANLPGYLLCSGGKKRADEDDEDEYRSDEDDASSEEDGKYKNRTERFLKEGMKTTRNFTMFQVIPRDMLKSIILGTVAWDYYPRKGKIPRDHYKKPIKNGYGIYVFGLAVGGREGKWLKANELNKLIGELRRYVRGYERWRDLHRTWSDASIQDVELRDFITEVDAQLGRHDTDASGPRYVQSEHSMKGMLDLIKSLQRRADKSLEINPAGDTPLIQTPIYTGLSANLASRMPKHDPNGKDGLRSSNKAHGIICSLMKLQGLQPKAVCVVALRLWDKDDLWFSETLVCALANGLINQDGFNRMECGSKANSNAPPLDPDGEEHVKVYCRYLHDNLEATLVDLRQRKAIIETLKELRTVLNDPVLEQAKIARARCEQVIKDMKCLPGLLEGLKEQIALEEKKLKATVAAVEILDLLRQFKSIDLSDVL
ncbi:hypothetical protein VMCG_10232 [Cytospora schulzeri]|uniref:Uncharacterized protein n=1 Tax=Cytospora schulzeri TaxID=448051 RepID=A0A423VEN7_9PEZI|nr:hypothetical protein VMCG_10232 [Valsa malicola]